MKILSLNRAKTSSKHHIIGTSVDQYATGWAMTMLMVIC